MDELEPPELPCSHKLAFDTKKQAEDTATVVLHMHGTRTHAYHCRYCHLWHLASD